MIPAHMHMKPNKTFERKFNSWSSYPIFDLGSREFIALRLYLPV